MRDEVDNMKIIAILAIMMAIMLAGCAEKVAEEHMEAQIEAETGHDAEVEIDGEDAKMTLETDEGVVQIETKGVDSDEWCKEGAEWKMTAEQGQAEMVIVGIESSGEYKGMCHVTYDIDIAEAQGEMDFYFDQEGNGYQVMNINGQEIKTEFKQ